MVAFGAMSRSLATTKAALPWPIRWLLRLAPATAGPGLGARLLGSRGVEVPSLPLGKETDAVNVTILRQEARRIDGASRGLLATLGRWDRRKLCRRLHLVGLEELGRLLAGPEAADGVVVVAMPTGREALVEALLADYTAFPVRRVEALRQEPGTVSGQEPGTASGAEEKEPGTVPGQEPGTWIVSLEQAAGMEGGMGLPLMAAVVWVTPVGEIHLRLVPIPGSALWPTDGPGGISVEGMAKGAVEGRRRALLEAAAGLLGRRPGEDAAPWPWHRTHLS